MAKYRKLGRTSNQRKALLRNQVTQLLYHGKIRTTEAKAKEKGLYRLEGKEYVMKDGDVVNFRFNV